MHEVTSLAVIAAAKADGRLEALERAVAPVKLKGIHDDVQLTDLRSGKDNRQQFLDRLYREFVPKDLVSQVKIPLNISVGDFLTEMKQWYDSSRGTTA